MQSAKDISVINLLTLLNVCHMTGTGEGARRSFAIEHFTKNYLFIKKL